MSLRDQVAPEFLIVVDLAVENHPDSLILVGDWLVAAVEIDDAEAAHPNGAASLDVEAFIVGSPMPNLIAHGPDGAQIRRPVSTKITGYSTHARSRLIPIISEPGRLTRASTRSVTVAVQNRGLKATVVAFVWRSELR